MPPVVTVSVASMVSEKVAVPVFPSESVAVTIRFEVTLEVVALAGVPVIAPVVGEMLRPEGSVEPLAAAQL